MRILIAGCGDIGSRAGLKMFARGHEVFGLKRETRSIPAAINPIQADLSGSIEADLVPEKIDQVFYIVAASEFTESAYRNAYVDGVRNLIEALGKRQHALKRFIFVSSSSVYSQNGGEWVDEDSVTDPVSFNGQVMLEGEELVQAIPGGLCVRFSGIYGPGRTRMIRKVQTGQFAPSEPVIFTNRIHVQDCARVLAHLSLLPSKQIGKNIILASDNQPASLHEVQHWLANRMEVSESARDESVPIRRAGSKRLCNRRLLETGFEFKYPDYKSGYKTILDGEQGLTGG